MNALNYNNVIDIEWGKYIEKNHKMYKHSWVTDYEYIYLFFNPNNNLIKIGISKKPVKRLKSLSLHYKCKIIPIFWVLIEDGRDAKAFFYEKFLHLHYKKYNEFGEWYRLKTFQIKQLIEFLAFTVEGMDYTDNCGYINKYCENKYLTNLLSNLNYEPIN